MHCPPRSISDNIPDSKGSPVRSGDHICISGPPKSQPYTMHLLWSPRSPSAGYINSSRAAQGLMLVGRTCAQSYIREGHLLFLFAFNFFLLSALTATVLLKALLHIQLTHVRPHPQDLHSDVIPLRGYTLKVLIAAASRTPHKGDARRFEDELHLVRVLLVDIHQGLPHLTHTALVDVYKRHHFCGFLLFFLSGGRPGKLGRVDIDQ